MKNPICPICGDELEYDEMIDELISFDGSEEKTYKGHCENCHKFFQWVEIWRPVVYYDLEEQDELE